MKKSVITLFLLIIYTTVMFAQSSWQHQLDSVMNILEKDSLFDGQLLIAQENEVLLHKAYGNLEDTEDRTPIGLDTTFKVYSVGKSITALAIILLKEQGEIDYNDHVDKYIKGFPYEGVKVKHLLTMTSGLPRFLETALTKADTTQLISNKEIIRLIKKHKPSAGKPGDKFEYNNSNYLLLANIVENVSGYAFHTFLNKYIFEPIGMGHTYESIPLIIDSLSKTKINSDNFYQIYGAGSIVTNVNDLFLYKKALLSGDIVKNENIKEAFECTLLNDGSYSNYGFGWRINDCNSKEEIYHVGDGENMRASLQHFEDNNKTFIYIHAFSNVYHDPVYWVIRNIWEGKPYELPTKRNIHDINPELYRNYVGKYLSNFGLIHITTDGKKLFLRPDPVPGKEELVPSSDTTFYFANQNLEWEFYLDEEGNVIGFGIKGDKENMGLKQ